MVRRRAGARRTRGGGGAGRGRSPVTLFRARAEAVGAEVRAAATAAQARRMVASLLAGLGVERVAAASDAASFVPAKARDRLIGGERAEEIAAAGAGIVLAQRGIAETGTLVHFDRSDADKNVWTLPPVCIAVLEARAVAGRLEDLLPAIGKHLSRPSDFGQVSLVTGTSRTADIENVLSTGVHGPGRLVIVVVGAGNGTRRP
jgi:L-lactate dehydrogenase complex protein LldG